MKRLSNIIVAAAVSFLLTGCGIYNKYEQKVQAPADAFGTSQDIERASGDTSIAQMSWREFFTDPQRSSSSSNRYWLITPTSTLPV